MMTDEAQPPTSSSSDANIPPPEPDPPPNVIRMSSPSPSQASQLRLSQSRTHSSGTSEDNQSSSPNSSDTPPWIKWSRGLTSLLDDSQGRDLFEKYLDQEGCSAQLNFLWACEGLKCTASEDPPKIPQLVRSIHRHFIQNPALLGISDTTRSDLAQAIKDGRVNEVGLFDKAEEEVQTHMQNNLYPNFLKSEIYLCAVNGEEEATSNLQEQLGLPHPETSPTGRKSSFGDSSSLGGGEEVKTSLTTALEIDVEQKSCNTSGGGMSPKIPSPPLSTAPSVLQPNQLQTVHEDKELSVNSQLNRNQKLKLGLTKEALHLTQTQRARAAVPVPPVVGNISKSRSREGFTSHYHQKPGSSSGNAPHPYHASYSAYIPVSRVDSEIQSMSSDAMTDDGASGHGHCSSRKHGAHSHRSKGQMSSSSTHLQHPHHHAHSTDPSRRTGFPNTNLNNRDNLPFDMSYRPNLAGGPRDLNPAKKALTPKEFAKQLIEKLEEVQRQRDIDEKLNQRLLECDDHVVVPNPIGASGGGGVEQITPNVLAAAINRLQVQDEGLPDDILDQHVSRVFSDNSPKLRSPTSGRKRGGPSLPPARARRERDLISTFSGDSGNVHDLYPADTLPSAMTKSRSIPNELRMHDHGDFSSVGASQRLRFSRGGGFGHGDSRNVPLALMTRKTSSEFIDSGISVVSGGTPTILSTNQPAPSLPCDRTDFRVAHWIAHEGCGEGSRRSKKPPVPPHAPVHMPPIGQPENLLEEVRKRFLGKKVGLPSAIATQSVQVPLGPSSSSSASRNLPHHHSPPSSDESSATTKEFISSFVFYEDTEQPYLVKIPCKLQINKHTSSSALAAGITLAVFKEHLPKRGNFRYFFKRECAEVYTNVVQEEITDDLQELPLFEGKIICCLQAAVATSSTSGTSI